MYQPGPFLGVMTGVDFPSVTFDAERGDRLFLFSDGLVEEWVGDEEFGVDRVLGALAGEGDLDAVVQRAVTQLESFVGKQGLTDDVTLLGIELVGRPSP